LFQADPEALELWWMKQYRRRLPYEMWVGSDVIVVIDYTANWRVSSRRLVVREGASLSAIDKLVSLQPW
jgi:hypothetical protein